MSKPPSLLRRASTSSALLSTGTMSAGIRPGPPSSSRCLRSSAQKPVSTVSGRSLRAVVVRQPALRTVLQVRQAVVGEGDVLQEVLGILFPGRRAGRGPPTHQ